MVDDDLGSFVDEARRETQQRWPTRDWFNSHPDVADEVKDGLAAGYEPTYIHRWLQEKHRFPYAKSSFQRWAMLHG